MFDLADVAVLAWTTKDVNGNAANAGTVTATVTLPDGTSSSPAITNTGTGAYQVSYVPTMPGRHEIAWVATGLNPQGFTDVFDVSDQNPPYLVSLADAKGQLGITTNTHDEAIRLFVESATAIVERHLDQVVIRRTITEEHYLTDYSWGFGQNYGQPAAWGVPARRLALKKSPAIKLLSVQRLDNTLTWDVVNNLHLNPAGIVDVLYGNPISGHVQVQYTAGLQTSMPANYILAAEIIIQHLYETQRGSMGNPRFAGLEDAHGRGNMYLGFAVPARALDLLGTGGKVGFA